ncbi:MAG: AsmA family protein, partial [Alistipes sp.]|nr:AsmA family protein [Alistipes sp.]
MKRLLKILSVLIVSMVLLLAVLPMAFKGKIESIVKQEGNKMLNAQFDFESLDISLLRHFPQASVSLKDFWMKGVGEFENDTLVYAGELTAAVNVMSIFGDEGFELSKIIVDDTRLHTIVLEDGTPNWDVLKPSEPTENIEEAPAEEDADSSFKLQLKKLSVNNLNLIYDDRQGGMYAQIVDFDASCAGNFASDNTTLRLAANTPSLTFRMGGVPFLSGAEIEADMAVAADFVNNKFTLNKNTLRLNAIKAAIDGWVALQGDGVDMDLKLNSNEIGFKEILSLIPAIYAKDFAGLRTDGIATLSAWAKGKMQGDVMPAFEANLEVKNAMFRYPSLPAGVDAINIAATVKNPGATLDSTTVNITPFNFTLAGNPFAITAQIATPISDLSFNVMAKGKLDLGKIKDVYPIEDMNLNGVVNADLSLNGKMSYIEQSQFDRVQAEGSVKLNDMTLQLQDIPNVLIKESVLSFSPRYVELSQTTINVGENDITLDSRFENYLGFVFKGSTLKGSLNVSSRHLNLNDFMSEDNEPQSAQDTAPEEQVAATSDEVLRVPSNIDFTMKTSFSEVLFEKMTFRDFNGLVTIKDGKFDMQNVSLNTMDGSVVVNGYYATPDDGHPSLNADFRLQEIGFAKAYDELYVIRQLAPIFSGLTGHFSGTIKIDSQLDSDMHPVLNTLNAYGS